jgi:CubicO group peptidase (beta-lactamase class C family)
MRALFGPVAILLIGVSCSRESQDLMINQRIERIENGLVAFESPAKMLQPDSTQLANPKNTTERMQYYKCPGVSIAVINDYDLEWTRVYGIINVNTGAPVTPETIFEAASTSKFITAVMALCYVQKGLIELDANVNEYLESWQVPENEFTMNEKVTLRRLLTHRAGLPTTNFSVDENGGYPTLIDVLNGKSPALNKAAVPEFVPGTKWQYSNVGYDITQLLLEDVSGKPFPQLAEGMIFEPLGMNNSSFKYPLDSEKRRFEPMPHDDEGQLRGPRMHLSALAHAGLTTTPTDLAKFTNDIILSYQGKSEKILSQKTARQLLNKEFDLDPGMFGLPISEGLGVFIMGEARDLSFMHPGSNLPGLNCFLIGWPERGTAAIVMTNSAKGEVLAMEIISAINLEYNEASY